MLAQEFTFEDALKAREEDGIIKGIQMTLRELNLPSEPEDIQKIMDEIERMK
jgi:hypothetical protein